MPSFPTRRSSDLCYLTPCVIIFPVPRGTRAPILIAAPPTMRALPTSFLARVVDGGDASTPEVCAIVLHDTRRPESIHDPIYEKRRTHADQEAHAQSSSSQRRSQPEVLSRGPRPRKSDYRARAVALRLRVGLERDGRNLLQRPEDRSRRISQTSRQHRRQPDSLHGGGQPSIRPRSSPESGSENFHARSRPVLRHEGIRL